MKYLIDNVRTLDGILEKGVTIFIKFIKSALLHIKLVMTPNQEACTRADLCQNNNGQNK